MPVTAVEPFCLTYWTGVPSRDSSLMLPKPTHLLLGFFGTVVEYSRSRTAQGYERTHDLTTRMGSALM